MIPTFSVMVPASYQTGGGLVVRELPQRLSMWHVQFSVIHGAGESSQTAARRRFLIGAIQFFDGQNNSGLHWVTIFD
jgi:hypothetical protein